MPSENLVLLRARVRYLEGKVGDVQRDFAQIVAEEQSLTQRTGARPGGRLALITLLPVGYPIAVAISSVGDWPTFDRQWAARTGPKVHEMMTALRRFEALATTPGATRETRTLNMNIYPAGAERAEANQLVDRGNRLARVAADLHHRWIANPISMRDTLNRGWGDRWYELLVGRNAPAIAIVGALSDRTATEVSSTVARRAGAAADVAGRAAEEVSRAASGAMATGGGSTLDTSRAYGSGASDGSGEERASWLPGLVTVGLVVVGGYFVVRIVKDTFLSPQGEQEA